MTERIAVVVPNWNGEDYLKDCIDSLLIQTLPATVIVVDNGSVDSSKDVVNSYKERVVGIFNDKNLGFAGGVNIGIKYALKHGYDSVALFNNDAVAAKDWLKNLSSSLTGDVGVVTCSFQTFDKRRMDSFGEHFSTWGLPYSHGRGEPVENFTNINETQPTFAATGGASLYSSIMLNNIGLFDEDFFAYLEDVDLSFRAQLAGWKVVKNPKATAYHHIGATSNKLRGFTVYQYLKNLPLTFIKNVPRELLPLVLPRFCVAYALIVISSIFIHRHPFLWIKALTKIIVLLPKKLSDRKRIQKTAKVSASYILSIMTHDLPENQHKLRKLRSFWWRIIRASKERS